MNRADCATPAGPTPNTGEEPARRQPTSPAPVVAAAIVDSLEKPTRLLAAQRSYPPELAGKYELPGGKVDMGEAPADALVREIQEELGATVVLGAPVPCPDASATSARAASPGFAPWPILGGRVMWVWFAQAEPGETPRALGSHMSLKWVDTSNALDLPWLPTNLPIVERCLVLMQSSQF